MVHTELINKVKFIRIEHGKANAIDETLLTELTTETADESLEGIILTGSGSFFSAGLNLKKLVNYNRDQMSRLMHLFHDLQIGFLQAPFPVIVAVNGHCIAGGFMIALSCDYRYCVPGSYGIGLNEMAGGISLPPIATERMNQLTEVRNIKFNSNRTSSPRLALAGGLVDEIVPENEILEKCLAAVRKFSRRFKSAGNKKLLNRLNADYDILYQPFLDKWFSSPAQNHLKNHVAGLENRLDLINTGRPESIK